MTEVATLPTSANKETTETVNTFDSTIRQDVKFYGGRTAAQTVSAAGALGAGFLLGGALGVLVVGGAMTCAYVVGTMGRNHDMRRRPDIGTVKMFERFGEKMVYRLGKKTGPRKVWLAREEEVRQFVADDETGAFMLGIRQSLPVKAFYTYPRLFVARVRDEINNKVRTKIPGQSGITFHEGVASRRLERAGMITPNPRTKSDIEYAHNWMADKGKTLG